MTSQTIATADRRQTPLDREDWMIDVLVIA
jgi:hypothetical protein